MAAKDMSRRKPNVLFVLADQWRQEAAGYAGNPDVRTPNLDAFSRESFNFPNAVSGCPICSPYRASLMTGQRPLTNGVFVNDVCLRPRSTTIAKAFAGAGYDTAYVGKWHLDGHGRKSYIPPERRLGFDYWKALECTHRYNDSAYYAGDSKQLLTWDGYDAAAQARDVLDYLGGRDGNKPFFLVLSWGPPHFPYDTAPEEFRALYDPAKLRLRPNVPPETASWARERLAGYYAHCSALDSCFGLVLGRLREKGLDRDTIVVFTSDHGDMLGSHGRREKQQPWDESVRVPFLLRWPLLPSGGRGESAAPIDAPDIMPTLLGLCGIEIPGGVEGHDFSGHLKGDPDPSGGAALVTCPHLFAAWFSQPGGREYRGLRTDRYTYARDHRGPWLLYDNSADPFQLNNLVGRREAAELQGELDRRLSGRLAETGDRFRPGAEYVRQWGYPVNETGTVPYTSD